MLKDCQEKREKREKREDLKGLYSEIAELKKAFLNIKPKSQLDSFSHATNIERVDPPNFKYKSISGSLVPSGKDAMLHNTHLRLFKDLKTVLNIKYKKNTSISDFLRSTAKLINSVTDDLDQVTYNLLIFDSLNDEAKVLVSHYLNKPIETLTPQELHEILIQALGSSIDPIGRKTNFYSYDPINDSSLKREDLNLANVIHGIKILGLKASASDLDIYQKVLSCLPPSSQVELKGLVRSEQVFNPNFIPTASDILKLLRDSTMEIETFFKNKKQMKLQKRDIFALESPEPEFVQNYVLDKKNFGFNRKVEDKQKINPNSFVRNTPRLYDGRAKVKTHYCLNCLLPGHKWETCGFTKLACQLCLKTTHPTPECPIYPNSTAVPTPCYYCRTQRGIKVHHPSIDCMLAKESEISEIIDSVANSMMENENETQKN